MRAAATVGVAESEGQCVGGVELRKFGETQLGFDHLRDLRFAGGALAGDGLFHFARGVFVDREICRSGSDERRPPSCAEDDGGAVALHKDDRLEHRTLGRMAGDDFRDAAVDGDEALRLAEGGSVFERAVFERADLRAVAFEDCEAGGAE